MIVSRSVIELRAQIAALRQRAKTIGVVPTMGWLHAGHLELVRRAAADCDAVVMSIFVNPRQFDNPADLERYPRDEARDLELARGSGVDLVFAPPVAEVYPNDFTATVTLTGPLVSTLEGEHRGPAHFAGVTTVVSKLFNMVGADRGYFGEKDAQQLRIIRSMVRDLNIDIEILGVPTVREPDGLAMSSRNVRLDPAARIRAVSLNQALASGVGALAAGERRVATIVERAAAVLAVAGICPEYLAVVDEQSFRPVSEVFRPARFLVAAEVGGVRLIDNMPLLPG